MSEKYCKPAFSFLFHRLSILPPAPFGFDLPNVTQVLRLNLLVECDVVEDHF